MRATSRGHGISYDDDGRGPAVVLVPGIMQAASDWRDAGYVDKLAGSRRVITVDPLGHGLSDAPQDPGAYREPDVAGDLVAVMDAAGVDRAVLWGYSRGARLASIAAIEFPGRVAALVAGGQAMSTPPELVDSLVHAWVEPLARGDWAGFWNAFVPVTEERKRLFEGRNDPRVMGAVLQAVSDSRYRMELTRVSAPAFLYCGAEDLFAGLMPSDAAVLGVDLHTMSGRDHSGAFLDTDAVIPPVLAHLEAVGA